MPDVILKPSVLPCLWCVYLHDRHVQQTDDIGEFSVVTQGGQQNKRITCMTGQLAQEVIFML